MLLHYKGLSGNYQSAQQSRLQELLAWGHPCHGNSLGVVGIKKYLRDASETKIIATGVFSGFGLTINGKQTFCGDFIFSGHTMTLVLSYLVVSECKFFG